jgi:hypothetical protein
MIPSDEDDKRQMQQWCDLYETIVSQMEEFGIEGVGSEGDFWVDTDNYATPQHKIYIHDLNLMRPAVIERLQNILRKYLQWEIVFQISVPGAGDKWPDMCLVVRPHEVVDFLQREYLPHNQRFSNYAGMRPPTAAELAFYSQ